jgi:hypothetical protein
MHTGSLSGRRVTMPAARSLGKYNPMRPYAASTSRDGSCNEGMQCSKPNKTAYKENFWD